MNKSPASPWLWIIEDDSEIRSVLVYFSEDEGFTTSTAATLGEARRLHVETQRSGRKPYAILSDYSLPDGDSESFLLECRQAYPDVSVTCITAHRDSALRERLKKHDILVLYKPVTLAELLKVLQAAVE